MIKSSFTIGSIASGAGMHLHGLKQLGGVPTWAIEMDAQIAHCYQKNHTGKIHIKKVEGVPPEELEPVDLLIATLSCKNASISKGANRGEIQADIDAANATCRIIKAIKPKWFMLENVWLYRQFEGFKLIQSTLEELGYYFKFYKFNLRDWGIAQSRDRLYALASRDHDFPDPVAPKGKVCGWYEALVGNLAEGIADLIPELPETELTDWQKRKFPELTSPLLLCSSAPLLLKRVGGGRDSDRLYKETEPSFTIRAVGRNSDYHSRIADAVVGDRIVAITPRACLRFFGDKETADKIWLPPTKSLACEVVGNGASWVMFKELFKCLAGDEMFKSGERVVSTHFLRQSEYEVAQYPANLHKHPHFVDEPDTPNPDWAIMTDGTPLHVSHLQKLSTVPEQKTEAKETDKWYTPPNIQALVTQVLGAIDLDPCADDGKHIPAATHYTASDDGLTKEWRGRVFMNPPYSCPGKWMDKLKAEVESGRVSEAIALVPAATSDWLHPLLESQPICFWKGRIKFLDTSYQPKLSARQSHCLIYWGANPQKFKQVFDAVGCVKNVKPLSSQTKVMASAWGN